MTLYIDTRPTLEWVEMCELSLFGDEFKWLSAKSVFGEYILYEPDNTSDYFDKYELYLYFPAKSDVSGDDSIDFDLCDTLEAAKAAAQADYEARTAERFRKVELPTEWSIHTGDHVVFVSGYNQAIRDIHEAIAKAKEQP